MSKQHIKHILDILMIPLMPCLMAYSLIGETFHEAAGILMFVCFVLHHILNGSWIKNLFRGRYTPRRIFQTVLDLLLLVFMLAQPVSGILISKHLFQFMPAYGISASAREIHICLGHWGFVLLSVHAGTHLPSGSLKRMPKSAAKAVKILSAAVFLYGIYAFIKRQFPAYMFRRQTFVFLDYSEPVILFLLDFLAVMAAFALIGRLLAVWFARLAKHTPTEKSLENS